MKPTEKEGGRNAILTEVDILVFDIIGSDSPAIIGLKVRDSQIETVEFDNGVMKDDAGTSVEAVNIASHVVAGSRDGFAGSVEAGIGVKSATIAKASIAGALVGYSNLAHVKLARASIGAPGVASAVVPAAGVACSAVPGADVAGTAISSIGVAGATISSVGVAKASVLCTKVAGARVSSERVRYLCGSSGSRTLLKKAIKPVRKRQAQEMIGSFSNNRKKFLIKIETFKS